MTTTNYINHYNTRYMPLSSVYVRNWLNHRWAHCVHTFIATLNTDH